MPNGYSSDQSSGFGPIPSKFFCGDFLEEINPSKLIKSVEIALISSKRNNLLPLK